MLLQDVNIKKLLLNSTSKFYPGFKGIGGNKCVLKKTVFQNVIRKKKYIVWTNIDCKITALNEYTDLPNPNRHPASSPSVRIETQETFFHS